MMPILSFTLYMWGATLWSVLAIVRWHLTKDPERQRKAIEDIKWMSVWPIVLGYRLYRKLNELWAEGYKRLQMASISTTEQLATEEMLHDWLDFSPDNESFIQRVERQRALLQTKEDAAAEVERLLLPVDKKRLTCCRHHFLGGNIFDDCRGVFEDPAKIRSMNPETAERLLEGDRADWVKHAKKTSLRIEQIPASGYRVPNCPCSYCKGGVPKDTHLQPTRIDNTKKVKRHR